MDYDSSLEDLIEEVVKLVYPKVEAQRKRDLMDEADRYLQAIMGTYYENGDYNEPALKYLLLHHITQKEGIDPLELLMNNDIPSNSSESIEIALYRLAKETAEKLHRKNLLDDEATLRLTAYATSDSLKNLLENYGQGITEKAMELMALSDYGECDLEIVESVTEEVSAIIRDVEKKYGTKISDAQPALSVRMLGECIRMINERLRERRELP